MGKGRKKRTTLQMTKPGRKLAVAKQKRKKNWVF